MTSPFERAFREELLTVARRDERRRRYTVRGAIVAVVAALAALAPLLLPGHPAAADVHVTVKNDVLEVQLTDSTSTPREVLDALHEHGLEAVVQSEPTGPSGVGRVLGVTFEEQAGSQVNVEYLEPSGSAYLGFRVPADWPGQMTIELGHTASAGQPYGEPTDAFRAGEPLHCSGVQGSTVEAAAGAMKDLKVRVAIHEGPELGRQLSLEEALATDYRGWFVTRAFAVAADDVILEVDSHPGPIEDPRC
jgi:hypothetical protein